MAKVLATNAKDSWKRSAQFDMHSCNVGTNRWHSDNHDQGTAWVHSSAADHLAAKEIARPKIQNANVSTRMRDAVAAAAVAMLCTHM